LNVKKVRAIVELGIEHSETIFRAILPETKERTSERYTGKLKKENGKLTFEFEANDIVAFRAALNAYLRWVKTIYDICELVKGGT